MKNLAREIARELLQIKAIKLSPQNPFTWASGMRSPIYCDNRVALSFPKVRKLIIDGFVDESQNFEKFDHISGVATAGIAHGALLANSMDLPFSYVRSNAKSHGRQNKIEGEISKGSKILVIEDLISTGGSSVDAIKALQEEGHDVIGTMAIFTYEFQKAVDNFKDVNCKFSTLSRYSVLLSEAIDQNYISKKEAAVLQEWNKNPSEWYSNNF